MNNKQLSESDICDKYIRPAMERAGWHRLDQIFREFPLRAGRVVVRGNKSHRDQSTVLRALCTNLRQRLTTASTRQTLLAVVLVKTES